MTVYFNNGTSQTFEFPTQVDEYVRGRRMHEIIDSGMLMIHEQERLHVIPLTSVQHLVVSGFDDDEALPNTVIRGATLIRDS